MSATRRPSIDDERRRGLSRVGPVTAAVLIAGATATATVAVALAATRPATAGTPSTTSNGGGTSTGSTSGGSISGSSSTSGSFPGSDPAGRQRRSGGDDGISTPDTSRDGGIQPGSGGGPPAGSSQGS